MSVCHSSIFTQSLFPSFCSCFDYFFFNTIRVFFSPYYRFLSVERDSNIVYTLWCLVCVVYRFHLVYIAHTLPHFDEVIGCVWVWVVLYFVMFSSSIRCRVAGYKFNFYARNHATQVFFHSAHNFLLILQKIGIRRSFAFRRFRRK